MTETANKKTVATLDLMKFIMALLVVGIHTEPFGFNIWLDRGYGIITRACVPFFFITRGYLFFIKEKDPVKYLKRIFILYAVWSIVFLPFDLPLLSTMTPGEILVRYLWNGNGHGLWYLCGTLTGFIITYTLSRYLKPKTVLTIGIVFLVIGCMKSTWAPLFSSLLHVNIPDFLGSRNGLFYGFPYLSLGLYIAKTPPQGKQKDLRKIFLLLIVSLFALIIESLVFVIIYNTSARILWISVLPFAYGLFLLGNNLEINLSKDISLFVRKTSTLIYVSQYVFILLLEPYLKGIPLFFATIFITISFAAIVIKLSEHKPFRWLKWIY